MTYDDALKLTDPGQNSSITQAPRLHVEVFTELICQMQAHSIRKRVENTYGENAYFNDTLRELQGAEAIGKYLEKSLSATNGVYTSVEDVAISGIDYYYRWKMEIRFRSLNNGRAGHSRGMSQIRYDETGRIVLHRDFWDAATGFFSYLPIFRNAIPWIKGRL